MEGKKKKKRLSLEIDYCNKHLKIKSRDRLL